MAKNNKLLMYGGIIALVLLVGALIGIVKIPTLSVGEQAVQTNTGAVPITSCNSATSTSVTFSILDAYGNNVTSDYNLAYSVNGNEHAAQVAAGSALTLSPNDVVVYHATEGGASHDVYGFSGTYTVPCKTTDIVTLTKGMQDTALSLTAYDTSTGNDNGANSGASPETLGAGATAKGRIYVAATTSQGVWSTSENGREVGVYIDYNNLVYKQPIITSVSDGTFTQQVGTPTGYVPATGNATVFYTVKSDALNNLGSLSIKFQAEALTGSTNPSAADGNISVKIADKEMFQKLDRTWATGFRNSDTGVDLGETDQAATLYVN